MCVVVHGSTMNYWHKQRWQKQVGKPEFLKINRSYHWHLQQWKVSVQLTATRGVKPSFRMGEGTEWTAAIDSPQTNNTNALTSSWGRRQPPVKAGMSEMYLPYWWPECKQTGIHFQCLLLLNIKVWRSLLSFGRSAIATCVLNIGDMWITTIPSDQSYAAVTKWVLFRHNDSRFSIMPLIWRAHLCFSLPLNPNLL